MDAILKIRDEYRWAMWSGGLLSGYNGGPAVYMKDGSQIRLLGVAGEVGKQYLRPERQIDLDQVDHVMLADGVRLDAYSG